MMFNRLYCFWGLNSGQLHENRETLLTILSRWAMTLFFIIISRGIIIIYLRYTYFAHWKLVSVTWIIFNIYDDWDQLRLFSTQVKRSVSTTI